MTPSQGFIFNLDVWKPALDKFGAVTHLSVILYDDHERIVCGPAPATALAGLFQKYGHDPGIFKDCARKCLAQVLGRPAVVVAPSYGLAVVGTSLVLEGAIVGAAVAGYALVDFSQVSAIEGLAHEARVPFRELWEIARRQQPIPQRRLVLHGELLQVLGDTILRENYRTRQYEDMAAKLEKEMAAKDEFLAVVSHELRTPLTPIFGWANILKTSENTEDLQRAAGAIERNAVLEMKLVDDLLDMSRIINEKMPLDVAVYDLSDVLRSALATIADVATGKKIVVECAGVKEPLTAEGDPDRLQQVFGNILSNAAKFTPEGGRIEVTVERDANEAIVRIADTGKGIAPEFLPHAFDMFRQQEQGYKRGHGGLGIGLALVKHIVESHRGQVTIASEGEGLGTVVTVKLPLFEAPQNIAATAGTAASEGNSFRFGHLTVLAVEDIEDTLETLRKMLEELGVHVLVAQDGVQALEVLSTARPDLVLCDLWMPRMDGFEFLRELSRVQGSDHPPVVAMTSLTSQADHRRTQAAGFAGHLDKPFDYAALASILRSVLDRRRSA